MSANPYLNFPGNTEEAFTYYRSVFGGEFEALTRFRHFPDNPMKVPEHELDKIAHVALPLGADRILMGTDVLESWPAVRMGNNYYIALETDDPAEADRLYERLADGGTATMPVQQTEWAEKYGTCVDRFGVQWMVMFTGSVEFPDGMSE